METREGERNGVDDSVSLQRDGESKGNAVMEATVEASSEKYARLRCMDLMAEWRRCICKCFVHSGESHLYVMMTID